ncbi:MAG: DUF2461 family protein [Bryobacteraceae bacterium]
MSAAKAILTPETFRFFTELSRNNSKAWMDANRDRYQQHVVAPLRELLEALTPAAHALNAGFVINGKTGTNFSRINRDIRFAKDKTPYHTRIYLTLFDSTAGDGGQLYVGISADAVTAGFRIYGGGPDFKTSPLALVGQKRAIAHPAWLKKQKARLGRKYESYWHSMEKGDWTKSSGWPLTAEEWKGVRAWIVRRMMKPTAAARGDFTREVERIWKDVLPLCRFVSSAKWKP